VVLGFFLSTSLSSKSMLSSLLILNFTPVVLVKCVLPVHVIIEAIAAVMYKCANSGGQSYSYSVTKVRN
jgi:hypothetical protein